MKSSSEPWRWAALVLAADRKAGDPVAIAAGVPCKALTPVGGVPMIRRVLQALADSAAVHRVTVVGPPRELLGGDSELEQMIAGDRIGWLAPAESPSASALRGLDAQPVHQPVLLTTADHALLSPAVVDYFLHHAQASGCDFLIGMARLDTVQAGFPGTRRTATRLRGGPYCSCNLFAFVSPDSRRLAPFWRRVEQQRKKPWRVVVGALGWVAVLRYLAGRLTLEQALARLSRRLGVRLGAVILPFAEAAVDVDTPADHSLVEAALAARESVPCQT
ncbi:nucleotidyltransferase family protein [Methyloversatilis sp.]|jgi:CTP:molybdopterin cytidylyltransferase MocA|uniref:nucleotidyltransferase family protein n=1 Tax=Methyloversatilis sp. TaxID=2569862 RepID=UPI0027BA06BC|nr:nucleotidyltransferase family protein [Methyloversatilis sp.]